MLVDEPLHSLDLVDGLFVIHALNLRADGCDDAYRVGRGAQGERHPQARKLGVWQVDREPRLSIEHKVFYITRDADNRAPLIARCGDSDLDSLADWVFVGKEAIGKALADDDNGRSRFAILSIELAPLHHRNSHGAKVIIIDGVIVCARLLAGGGGRTTFGAEGRVAPVAARRERSDFACRFYFAQRLQPLE